MEHRPVLLPVPLYVAFIVVLLTGSVAAWSIPWQGSVQFHTLMETVATLLALIIGVIGLVRFYSNPTNTTLFIGAGFLGAACLDGYHAVVTSSFFVPYLPSSLPALSPWSWFASRFYLAVFLWIGWLVDCRAINREETKVMNPHAVLTGAALLTVFSFLFFVLVPLPRGYYPEFIVQRPVEFIAAFFFLFTLVGYLRKATWKQDHVEHWLVMSLLVGSVSQGLVMAGSTELFDMRFDLAHGLKIISYILILTGLLISMYMLFQQAEASIEEIKRTNQDLAREILKRKRVEQTLEQSQNMLSTAEAVVHLGSWEWNIKTGEESWSDEQYRIFGYEPGEVTPTYETFLNALHRDDKDMVLQAVENALRGERYDLELRILRPDQSIRTIQATGQVHFDDDDKPLRIIGTVLDITERIQRDLIFRQVIEAAPNSMIMTDQSGCVVLVNRQTEKLFGYKREEIINHPVEMLLPERFRKMHDHHRASFAHTEFRLMGEGRILSGLKKDGEEFYIDVGLSPLTIDDKSFVLASMIDVTKSKKTEMDLIEKQRLLDAFHHIGEATISTFDIEQIQNILVEQMVQVGIFRSLTMAIVDYNNLAVHVVKTLVRRPEGLVEKSDLTELSYALDDTNIMAETARTGEMQVVEGWDERFDTRIDAPNHDFEDKISYFIPVIHNKKICAVLATASTRQEKDETLRRIETMQPLLNLVAIALEQARLYEESRKYTDNLAAINIALGESENRFRGIFNNAAIGITVVHPYTGNWLTVNPAFCRIVGYSEEELLTRAIMEITPNEDLEAEKDRFGRYLVGEFETYDIEKRYIRKDGSIIWVHLTGRLVHNDHEEPIYSIFGVQDITDQKKAEAALDQAYHREEAIGRIRERILAMRHVDELVDLLKQEWKDALIALGVPVHRVSWQIPGKDEGYFISNQLTLDYEKRPYHQERITDYPWVQKVWETGQPALATRADIDCYFPQCDASIQCILEVPLPGMKGSISLNSVKLDAFGPEEIRNIHLFAGLISEGLLRVRDFDTLEKQAQDLKASNKELEQFAYVASHDLQEPLRMVASYMQLLERRYKEKLDETAVEFINFAVDGAKRMQTLINDLLAYSHVGTRKKSFEPKDMNGLLVQVLSLLKMAIDDTGAVITQDDLPVILGDEIQLSQLFQNLISNALKFHAEEPPNIHIACQRDDDVWTFSVQDNGIGIDPQYAERIFVIFQRLHTREEYPGTGMGLAICKKIVERHGGQIWLESKPDHGTTFFFTLPAYRRHETG